MQRFVIMAAMIVNKYCGEACWYLKNKEKQICLQLINSIEPIEQSGIKIQHCMMHDILLTFISCDTNLKRPFC